MDSATAVVIAGIIEGFFSPNPAIPDFIKYLQRISHQSGT
jgi:uncharacterized membrane protein SpoIIM required for sporulation